ncbi:MAG: type II toxin-antitoxin system VapC family toxin [Candidatus Aquilonibacter sp.]
MLLLDTSVFLKVWLRPDEVSAKALREIGDDANNVFVSSATAWEIVVKHAVGKLELPGDPALFVPRQIREARFLQLPITIDHALAVQQLPMHHADPFDRILIAQAQFEGLTLVTTDKQLRRYDVRVMMA